jgi:hypothetical protein
MELALESMESQRAVMYDPSKAYLFLQFTDGNGNKNGTVYNERQVPGDRKYSPLAPKPPPDLSQPPSHPGLTR